LKEKQFQRAYLDLTGLAMEEVLVKPGYLSKGPN
jgi:hypothetical protein